MPLRLFAVLFAALICGDLAAADQWFHVRIDERHGKRVTINLPFTMVERIADVVPRHYRCCSRVRVRLCSHDLSLAELRVVMASLRSGGGEPVVLPIKGGDPLRFEIRDGALRVEMRERRGGQVEVLLPVAVADALLSGHAHEPDLTAAARALAASGGKLILVSSSDATVNIWVDRRPDGRTREASR